MTSAWTRARKLIAATVFAVSLGGASMASSEQLSGITEAQALKFADQEIRRRAKLENEGRKTHGMPTITFEQFLSERHANTEVRTERQSTPKNSCTFRHMYVSSALGSETQYEADRTTELWKMGDAEMANQLLGRSYYLVQYGNEEPSASRSLYFHAGYCVFVDAVSGNILYFVYRN